MPYIIALILGIAVIAVLVYWFFTVSSRGTITATSVECDTAKFVYCNELVRGGKPDDTDVKNKCGNTPTKTECKAFLGIS